MSQPISVFVPIPLKHENSIKQLENPICIVIIHVGRPADERSTSAGCYIYYFFYELKFIYEIRIQVKEARN